MVDAIFIPGEHLYPRDGLHADGLPFLRLLWLAAGPEIVLCVMNLSLHAPSDRWSPTFTRFEGDVDDAGASAKHGRSGSPARAVGLPPRSCPAVESSRRDRQHLKQNSPPAEKTARNPSDQTTDGRI